MIHIKKTKNFGPGARGYTYRAFIGDNEIAAAPKREQAQQQAEKAILDAMQYQHVPVAVARAADGAVIIVRQLTGTSYELQVYRGESGVLRGSGGEFGGLGINGKRVTAAEYLSHWVKQYDAANEEL